MSKYNKEYRELGERELKESIIRLQEKYHLDKDGIPGSALQRHMIEDSQETSFKELREAYAKFHEYRTPIRSTNYGNGTSTYYFTTTSTSTWTVTG